jgi:hypothetical protein
MRGWKQTAARERPPREGNHLERAEAREEVRINRIGSLASVGKPVQVPRVSELRVQISGGMGQGRLALRILGHRTHPHLRHRPYSKADDGRVGT